MQNVEGIRGMEEGRHWGSMQVTTSTRDGLFRANCPNLEYHDTPNVKSILIR